MNFVRGKSKKPTHREVVSFLHLQVEKTANWQTCRRMKYGKMSHLSCLPRNAEE